MEEGTNGSDFWTVKLTKPSKKLSKKYWQDLKRDVTNLTVRYLKRFAVYIEATDYLIIYTGVLELLIKRASISEDTRIKLVMNWFQSYAAFCDECAYVLYGSMIRDYHRHEDAKFALSSSPSVSVCCTDGINGLLQQIDTLTDKFKFDDSAVGLHFADVDTTQVRDVMRLLVDVRKTVQDALDKVVSNIRFEITIDESKAKGSKIYHLVVGTKREMLRMDSGFPREVFLHDNLGTKDSVKPPRDLIPSAMMREAAMRLESLVVITRMTASLKNYFPPAQIKRSENETETQLDYELAYHGELGDDFGTSSGQSAPIPPDRTNTQLNVELDDDGNVDLGSEFENPLASPTSKSSSQQSSFSTPSSESRAKLGCVQVCSLPRNSSVSSKASRKAENMEATNATQQIDSKKRKLVQDENKLSAKEAREQRKEAILVAAAAQKDWEEELKARNEESAEQRAENNMNFMALTGRPRDIQPAKASPVVLNDAPVDTQTPTLSPLLVLKSPDESENLASDIHLESDEPASSDLVPGNLEDNLDDTVEALYSVIEVRTGKLGGDGSGGPTYGELQKKSMQRVLKVMAQFSDSKVGPPFSFIDLGGGLGKPALHAALLVPKFVLAVSIECQRERHYVSIPAPLYFLIHVRSNLPFTARGAKLHCSSRARSYTIGKWQQWGAFHGQNLVYSSRYS